MMLVTILRNKREEASFEGKRKKNVYIFFNVFNLKYAWDIPGMISSTKLEHKSSLTFLLLLYLRCDICNLVDFSVGQTP